MEIYFYNIKKIMRIIDNSTITQINMRPINKKWAILALVWLTLLMYALLLKPTGSTPILPNVDKIAHFGLFFGQFWLIARSILACTGKTYWVVGVVLAIMLAVGSKLLQGLTGYRSMEIWDGVADVLGAMVALSLIKWADKNRYLR